MEDAEVRVAQYEEELEWIDDHLFKDVDTKATRDFITEPDNIESKRLLAICDFRDRIKELQAKLETAVDGLKEILIEARSELRGTVDKVVRIEETAYQTLKSIQEESEKQDTRTPPQKAADLCQKIEQAQEVTKNSKQVFKKEESEGK